MKVFSAQCQEKQHIMVLRNKNLNNRPKLTSRESEILEHVAQGLSTKEVAQQLDIAPRTVARHVENIRLKLRAKNRSHMVVCAVMAGLLNIDVVENYQDSEKDFFHLLDDPDSH